MHEILIAGAGRVGAFIACLLTSSNDYNVHFLDTDFKSSEINKLLKLLPQIKTVVLDIRDKQAVLAYIKQNSIIAIISSLPYFLNTYVATCAKEACVHYFDLTEDTAVSELIENLAKDSKFAFVPQCGTAPGIIGIIANSLMREFDSCETAKLRVGALPEHTSNALNYALTWSTDGLINQYANPCQIIQDGRLILVPALEALEEFFIDGKKFEAFYTSGGLGSLAKLYTGKIQNLDYKTIRYPGHCEKMRFLMQGLGLSRNRDTLKHILETNLAFTNEDIVIIFVSVTGKIDNKRVSRQYVRIIHPQIINNLKWSAIQVSSGAGACVILDLVLNNPSAYNGYVLQETFDFKAVLSNRFGKYYAVN